MHRRPISRGRCLFPRTINEHLILPLVRNDQARTDDVQTDDACMNHVRGGSGRNAVGRLIRIRKETKKKNKAKA